MRRSIDGNFGSLKGLMIQVTGDSGSILRRQVNKNGIQYAPIHDDWTCDRSWCRLLALRG